MHRWLITKWNSTIACIVHAHRNCTNHQCRCDCHYRALINSGIA